jgi:hypothetical protein
MVMTRAPEFSPNILSFYTRPSNPKHVHLLWLNELASSCIATYLFKLRLDPLKFHTTLLGHAEPEVILVSVDPICVATLQKSSRRQTFPE